MSDTNRVALRFKAESTAGTIPTGAYAPVPFTGSSDLGATPETVVSDIIRSDREVTDLIKVNESIGGQFDTELMPGGAFNDLLLGMLQAASWSTETEIVSSGTAVTVTVGTTSGTLGSTGAFTSSDVAVGDFVEVVQGTLRGYFRVLTRPDNNTITVEGPLTGFASGSNITITNGAAAENGTTTKSFTFEREYTDHSPTTFEYLSGLEVDTFSVTASASSIVTASFGMLGMKHVSQTSRQGSVTTGTDVSTTPFNASSNVATIGEAGAPGLQVCTELTMEVANNLRQLNVIGVEGATSVGSGEFNVTGSLSVYFENNTLLEKLLNNTQTSLSFGFSDGTGNALIFDMPAIKFSEGVPEVSGKNEDVMLNLGYQAFRDSTDEYTLRVTRFTAA